MEQAYCDAIRIAFELEKSGEQLYRNNISKVTNEFAKHVLEFLAQEELVHIKKIESFNDALLGQGEFNMETECAIGVNERIRNLVTSRVSNEQERFAADTTDLNVYSVAMDMEKKGYESYESALHDSKSMNDGRLIAFFEFMLAEEKEHYELLAQSKKYLEDPAYYFSDYGGWIFS